MICKTKVGQFDIPVRGHFASIVTFKNGQHGKKEMGEFAFWTAVLRRPVKMKKAADIGAPTKVKIVRRITGRAQVGYPAGDRFDRMKREMLTSKDAGDRRAYRRMWVESMKKGQNIAYIRPSTKREIRRWMLAHQSDAAHAVRIFRYQGKPARAAGWTKKG